MMLYLPTHFLTNTIINNRRILLFIIRTKPNITPMFNNYLHCTGISIYHYFVRRIFNPMKFIDLSFNIHILLIRFPVCMSKHENGKPIVSGFP